MGLHGPVLVATDFSEAADAALRQGHAIATDLDARLVVCHVLPEAFSIRMLFPQDAGVDTRVQHDLERKARDILRDRIGSAVGTSSRAADIEIESGTPHAGILGAAERLNPGLIVVGPGRTAQRVARSAAMPVLIARPSPTGGAVLGATDFSDPSLPAVRMAADEAVRRGIRLRLLHCLDLDPTAYLVPTGVPGVMPIAPVPPSMIEQLEAQARGRLGTAIAAIGADADPIVLRRPPALGIVETARDLATVLVVVGTRGRTGLTRIALGSVAEDVVSHAPCSVLVVPLHLEN